MKQFFITAMLLIASCLYTDAQPTASITVDGISRSYNYIVPRNLGEKRPLLIFCHGYNQDAGWMQNSEFKNDKVSMEAVCDTAKFICVFPNGIDRAWDTGGNRDINFIKAIIEKMANDYDIDRNRVYLGGFSMGGMLTYNAINKMHDVIAAFVSCSGPAVVTPNSKTRPVPILHIQGTADNFGGVQPALNPWINHNGCSTTDRVINNYNGFSGAKLHIWGPGNDGVEVRLIELKDKGHWICKETQVYTGKEIWNFCKNYSLNKTTPSISIISPKQGGVYTCFAPSGQATFPDITLAVNAYDSNGTIAQVEFFDNGTSIATCTSEPYETTLSGAAAGSHTIKVVATDNDGETSSTTTSITLSAPAKTLNLSQKFNEGGCVPAGWTTYDGSEYRYGYSSGFSMGCRILQLKGSQRDFTYGLYFRNTTGATHDGYAKYGLPAANSSLTLSPGHYTLSYRICNWNCENFAEVELSVEKAANAQAVASTKFMPTVNVGNNAENSFSGTKIEKFEFDITETDNYALAVYSAARGWSDALIGYFSLEYTSQTPTAIKGVSEAQPAAATLYNLAGQTVSPAYRGTQERSLPAKGIYILNGKKLVVK